MKKLISSLVSAAFLFSSVQVDAAYIPPAGANNAIQYNKNGQPGGFVLGGDCTVNTATGAQTCTKTNGVNFAPSATTDTTNAANITSGTLPVARGGTGANALGQGIDNSNNILDVNTANLKSVPANSWTAIVVAGDVNSYNLQFNPLSAGWGGIVARQMGAGVTYRVKNSFSAYDCDIVEEQIVPNANPQIESTAPILWLPTGNDAAWGNGVYANHLADTTTCRMGAITWSTVPAAYKIYAQNSAVTSTGTWANGTEYGGGKGKSSNTNGSTLALPITSYGKTIYLWYRLRGADGGTFTYNIDGGANTTVATQGNNQFTFPIDNTKYTLGVVRIPSISAGQHTINVAVTSASGASNTVIIEGVGTVPPGNYHGSRPSVFLGGQVKTNSTTDYTAAELAFNTAGRDLVTLLASDGLNVSFADVRAHLVHAGDYSSLATFNKLTGSGMAHLADAFMAVIQAVTNSSFAMNPRDFGASCNSQYFSPNSMGQPVQSASGTAGSSVISISNYVFRPGVASQFGGGDVGKRICIGKNNPTGPGIPCTYIASVNTTNNTATLGINAVNTFSGSTTVMGGYPSDPNDPSTAQDDTNAIVAAANASLNSGNGIVRLPNECMVHNMTLPQNVTLAGDATGSYYLQQPALENSQAQGTILECGFTGLAGDPSQTCINTVPHTAFRDFMFRGPVFPVPQYAYSAACLGYGATGGTFPGGQVMTDNLSFFGCPVGIGQAYGYNYAVTFTAAIVDNGNGTSTMTVSSIDSSNFNNADTNWMAGGVDYLNVNRTVTGSGIPANTKITSAPIGGGVGTYILDKGATFASGSLTSPANTQGLEIRSNDDEFIWAAIGMNGDFTDSQVTNPICTGTFGQSCWRLGPAVASFGNTKNRLIGGRSEEMAKAAIVCDGCELTITGHDWDSNGGYNIRTKGSSPIVQLTGGIMSAGGHCAGYNNIMVSIAGTNPNISINGTTVATTDFGSGCGGNTNTFFVTESGATMTSARVSATGLLAKHSNSTLGSNLTMFDWTNGTPAFYKQDIAGFSFMDNTQTILSASAAGNVGIGTATPNAGASLDVSAKTDSIIPPKGTTGQQPASPVEGMLRYNTTIHGFEGYKGSTLAWNSLNSASEATVNLGGSLSGTVNIDLQAGSAFYGTVAGNTTFTVTNPPVSGTMGSFSLTLVNPGAFTLTWTNGRWAGGSPPTFTASGTDVIVGATKDAGSNVIYNLGIKDAK